MNEKTLALFFTKGMSFAEWERIGMLRREVLPYQELAKRHKKLYIITYGGDGERKYASLFPSNVRILPKRIPVPSTLYSVLIPLLYWRELRRVEISKTNQMSGSWAAVLTKYLHGTKLIVRCGYEWLEVMEKRGYATWKLRAAALLERVAYTAAEVVVFSNAPDKEYARRRFGIPSSKMRIVPNFVDTEFFSPRKTPRETDRIIFVGKLTNQKNVSSLISAVSGLPLRLVVVGDGPLRGELEEQTKKTGGDIEFKGNLSQERLVKEFAKSSVFVLPSLYEGHPKALLEAMSCGMVCLGTDVKGIAEIIRHGENGYLCKPTAESISHALKEIIVRGKPPLSVGEEARETIRERFGADQVLQEEFRLYQEI